MVSRYHTPTRRDVLRTIAGGVGTAGLAGVAAGKTTDGEVVNVGYAEEAGRRAVEGAATRVVREFSFDALTVEVGEDAISTLQDRDEVRYVEPNAEMRVIDPANGREPDGSVGTSTETLPWGVDRVDAEVAHAYGDTGESVDVAIVDTGIDSDHPDLQANLGEGKAFVECTDGTCICPWDDDQGHGTHCAGIAGAVDNEEGVIGVAPSVTLHAVKAFDQYGFGMEDAVAAGIEWVADQGYDVASMSFGAVGESALIRDAVEYAYEQGVFLAGAAGNTGPCADCVNYPGKYDVVMAVTAMADDDSLGEFSSTGPEIDIIAPGVDVYSTVPGGYYFLSGTSMAAPHVAAAGALLMTREGCENTGVHEKLKSTAENVGLAPEEAGAGLLDVAAALDYPSADDL